MEIQRLFQLRGIIMKYKKIIIFAVLLGVIFILFASCSSSNLNISSYEYRPKEKSLIYSADGELIGQLYNENRTYVELDKIPKHIQEAVIAVEDSRFYSHSGFDIIRLIKAIFVDIKEREFKEGASTLTQQLAKNLFLTNEKTITRKIKELLLSLQLERKYSKDKILEMYLNEIYLGQMVYGVQEASLRFLGKDVWDLTLAEGALIVGLAQAPSAYNPVKYFDKAKKRQEIVLDRMAAVGNISKEQAQQAKGEEIKILEKKDNGFRGKYKEGHQHFVNKVVEQLIEYFSERIVKSQGRDIDREEIEKLALYEIENGGYKIYTTLNQAIQGQALIAMKNGIKGLGVIANGALVSIEPSTGKVLAYYGGVRDIDMANKPRRPGSTIKPLYYAGAINEGLINGNTIVLDEPADFNGYKPKNYGNKYFGYVTTREALVNSLNVASVKIMNYLGVDKALEYIKGYGISTIAKEDYQLATGLGGMTHGITPLELTSAYGVIANKGWYKEPYFIEKVENSNGDIIYSVEEQGLKTEQVLLEETSGQIEDILIDVVSRGTGTSARLSYYNGGKTGTTDNKKDLWFVGFVKPIVTTIWLGNEDNLELNGGSSASAKIYKNYMNNILKNQLIKKDELQPVTNYQDILTISILLPDRDIQQMEEINEEDIADIIIPSKEYSYFQDRIVERVTIDSSTGKLFVEGRCPEENWKIKIYLRGQGPQEQCDPYHFFDKFYEFYNNFRPNNNELNNWEESYNYNYN